MSTEPPEPGIYPGVPFPEYFAWDAVNATFLSTLARRTPYHAKHNRDFPKDETDALRIGRALHSLVLEPATFGEFWALCPPCDKRTTVGKQVYADFTETKGSRGEISSKEFVEITELAIAIRAQQCVNMICGGRAEVSIVWRDKETGLLCKRRLDYERSVPGDWNHYITDLKSTTDAGKYSFGKDLATYGYAMAAAFSIDGWQVLTGESSVYTLLAAEKEYHVAKVWEPDDDTIDAGRDEYRKALDRTAECMKKNEWPAYGSGAELLRAPEWYLHEHGISQFQM